MATVASFAAVVLAAGAASRFGGGKLLADFRGAPLLHGALAAARAATPGAITVVTGADAEAVAACARAFDPDIRLVHAADHAEGMAASLRAGIASLAPEIDAAFVFLGDMPRVPQAVLAPLAAAVAAGAPAAAPVFGGRRGNPVVLGRALFGEVAALRGDVGARPILQALGARLALVETDDDGVLFDVDERSDLTGR
ncbi:MAG: NTP transferase domain-containing protein [Alphaproteobacteria bacterium]|nr:NTP transferase domain-containing protein [Alphaproteobacteria bacterium]MBU1517258.1 NTP transferase domain-containing protein [Alphaproteobacteria bacterium]MBU2093206.1 NTP transferase domain-containing protein [Alphaproteobacteria bacterium]MBU2153168.1 NTP transferase domain-containing protein [Alphaproteobacteria bacterium]MBU2307874.1 NTP transferase domain-containing protein [Alphaproteobacteria bacterium]